MPPRLIYWAFFVIVICAIIVRPAFATKPSLGVSFDQLQNETTVVGVVNRATLALYYIDSARICNVERGDRVLAVARAEEGNYYRVYTSSEWCEGVVWISGDADISWEPVDGLEALPTLVVPPSPEYLDELDDYQTICEAAVADNRPIVEAPPENLRTIFLPGGWSFIPAEFVAEREAALDVVICLTPSPTEVGACPIANADELLEVPRIQENLIVTMVDFVSGDVIARELFEGGTPPSCPFENAEPVAIHGTPPMRRDWGAWVIGTMLGAENATPSFRSVSAAPTVNARPEPTTDTTILGQLSAGTPVNLIGRNEEGDWVVALLPDMTKAWLFVDLLNVAVQIDLEELPVYDGPAEEVPIPVR